VRIAIVARMKQGDILEALEKRGWTQKEGAKFIGMNHLSFQRLINLRWVPQKFSPDQSAKLLELTGKTTEELFPEYMRVPEFLDGPKVIKKYYEAEPGSLQAAGMYYLPEAPDKLYDRQDLARRVELILSSIPEREARIVRRTIMEEATFEEVAEEEGLSAARIWQIKERAIRLLRHPNRTRYVRSFL
jgi:transcriptional regulator with XRE-family HTH domain